jgi:hypothetical protein
MNNIDLDIEKYPVGKFVTPSSYTQQEMLHWIEEIKLLPGKIRQTVISLNETQLDTPYRLGGWTIRQVIHHIADSHANAMIRFKLALTEDNPTVKAYEEAEWALLPDYRLPVEPALRMLEGVHLRWVAVLEAMSEDQWNRTYIHPATGDAWPLRRVLGLYAWHSRHHLAHIMNALKF